MNNEDKMINIEISKEHELFSQLISEYPSAPVIEINSFGADAFVSVLIPLAAILAPIVSPIIVELIRDRRVKTTMMYDNKEFSGDYQRVMEIINQLRQEQKNVSTENDEQD